MQQIDPVGAVSVACVDGEWFVFCRVQGLYDGRLVRIGPAPNEAEARAYARQVAAHIVQQLGPNAYGEIVVDTEGPQA